MRVAAQARGHAVAVLGLLIASQAIAVALPDGVLRAVVALPPLLFIPGYLLAVGVIPAAQRDNQVIQVGASVIVSVALLALVPLLLYLVGIEATRAAIVISIVVLSAGFCALPSAAGSLNWPRVERTPVRVALTRVGLLLVGAVALAGAVVFSIALRDDIREPFSETFLAGELSDLDGALDVVPGERLTVPIAFIDHRPGASRPGFAEVQVGGDSRARDRFRPNGEQFLAEPIVRVPTTPGLHRVEVRDGDPDRGDPDLVFYLRVADGDA